MFLKHFFALSFLFSSLASLAQNNLYQVKTSEVTFSSNAPLELIEASSSQLKGVVDTTRSEFAFKIFITSFKGFNNPLQREHFNENYMETTQFPVATYSGKIIENINYARDGTYTVRTKGKMTIHGITRERIIMAEITILNGKMKIKGGFTVLLSDYGIKIPKIVGNNLAKEIKVKVTADLISQR